MSDKNQTCFISYSREDSKFCAKLAKELIASGVNVWFDKKDISAGKRWTDSIEEAIKSCHKVILIMSPQSNNSRNVKDEICYATMLNRIIIPIMYQQCDLQLQVASLNYIDFTSSFKIPFRELLEVIEEKVASEDIHVEDVEEFLPKIPPRFLLSIFREVLTWEGRAVPWVSALIVSPKLRAVFTVFTAILTFFIWFVINLIINQIALKISPEIALISNPWWWMWLGPIFAILMASIFHVKLSKWYRRNFRLGLVHNLPVRSPDKSKRNLLLINWEYARSILLTFPNKPIESWQWYVEHQHPPEKLKSAGFFILNYIAAVMYVFLEGLNISKGIKVPRILKHHK